MNVIRQKSLLRQTGESYYQSDVGFLKNLVEEDCQFQSFFHSSSIQGKKDIVSYYESCFLGVPKNTIRYRIIQLKQEKSKTEEENLGLLLWQPAHPEIPKQLLFLTWNEKEKITSIRVDTISKYDYEIIAMNWGEGIPNYSQNDVLTEDEIFDYCFKDLYRFIQQQSKDIIYFHNDKNAVPTFIFREENKIKLILLQASATIWRTRGKEGASGSPNISNKIVNQLLHHTFKHRGSAYIVSLNMYSRDKAREKAGLALYGDTFNIEGHPLLRVRKVYGQIRYYFW